MLAEVATMNASTAARAGSSWPQTRMTSSSVRNRVRGTYPAEYFGRTVL